MVKTFWNVGISHMSSVFEVTDLINLVNQGYLSPLSPSLR